MINKANYVLIDSSGKEIRDQKGFPPFNLIVNDGEIQLYAGGYIPSHWHKELELFVLLEGEIQIGIGNTTYQLQKGDGCFINTEVLHSFTATVPSPCTFRSFVFSADIVGGIPGSIFDAAYVRPLMESGVPFLLFKPDTEDALFFTQFDKAFHASVEEPYGYEYQVRDAFSNILLYAKSKCQNVPQRTVSTVQEERLKEMLGYINENLDKNITVSRIAATVNICARECQRIFNQYLHYSPMEYVLRQRIFTAAKLLTNTDRAITDIALYCGFSNPSYFSKQFKLLMGSTPREYRTLFAVAFPESLSSPVRCNNFF